MFRLPALFEGEIDRSGVVVGAVDRKLHQGLEPLGVESRAGDVVRRGGHPRTDQLHQAINIYIYI